MGEQNGTEQPIVVKIEDDEYVKKNKNTSTYFGVSYSTRDKTWCARRHRKNKNMSVYNGTYRDEQTAAHASDTLARKLIADGEKSHKLNFPDDDTEVYPKQQNKYFGVNYHADEAKWYAYRRSKNQKKIVYNGSFKDEVTAAHASDTLARKLIANGETHHKLNFPDDDTEMYAKKKNNYFGTSNRKILTKWQAHRWNKHEKKTIYVGSYRDEETAAHASDTLALKLMAYGENGHKLNFPDDNTEVYPIEAADPKKKRK